MPPPADIRSRLDLLASRKRQRDVLIDEVRGGAIAGISTAAEFFAGRAEQGRDARATIVAGAEIAEGPGGRCFVVRGEFAPNGDGLPMAGCAPVDGAGLPLLTTGEVSSPLAETDIAFVDTETTGLAGGTGTVAFLVGVGWWEQRGGESRFVLEQFLIDDFRHEEAMLSRLVARLAPFRALCTYNGRRFDVPLLRARAVMHRIAPRAWSRPQIDLLDFSRRLWKGRIGSVSLKNVERHILGIDRGEDIDGGLIPEVFFRWARTGEAPLIPAVLRHNAQDIVTLGALLARASRICADPMGCGLLNHHAEFAAAAKWFEKRKDPAAARAAWERALEASRGSQEERPLLHRLALYHKRHGDREEAAAIWRGLPGDNDATIQLAMHLEHRRRDPAEALRIVRGLRQRLEWEADMAALRDGGKAASAAALADLIRREERLLRKSTRSGDSARG